MVPLYITVTPVFVVQRLNSHQILAYLSSSSPNPAMIQVTYYPPPLAFFDPTVEVAIYLRVLTFLPSRFDALHCLFDLYQI